LALSGPAAERTRRTDRIPLCILALASLRHTPHYPEITYNRCQFSDFEGRGWFQIFSYGERFKWRRLIGGFRENDPGLASLILTIRQGCEKRDAYGLWCHDRARRLPTARTAAQTPNPGAAPKV